MSSGIQRLTPEQYADYGYRLLHEIPDPPEQLWCMGTPPASHLTLLAVVGSRAYTTYGRQVVETLLGALRGQPIGIVSGLARGIDGLAHTAALDAGLYTLAIPGSGLDPSVIYPRQHRGLADRICEAGGGLLSELPPQTRAARWTFPRRNRLMAGISHATLLVEAKERSGTLITARLCAEYDRELLVVPGNIFSPGSRGTHQFLKLGATPVTSPDDILDALQLPVDPPTTPTADTPPPDITPTEANVLEAMHEPVDLDTIITRTQLPSHEVSTVLMSLELRSCIRSSNGLYHRNI